MRGQVVLDDGGKLFRCKVDVLVDNELLCFSDLDTMILVKHPYDGNARS